MSPNNSDTLTSRIAALSNQLVIHQAKTLVLNPGPSLVYLTGLHFHLSERPVLAIFRPHTPPVFILPKLEALKLDELPFAFQAFPYGEDPGTWDAVFRQALQAAQIETQPIGVEPRGMRVLELRFLEEAAPRAKFISAEEIVTALRIKKDFDEIAAMRKAAEIAQAALEATLPAIQIGMSEKEIAGALSLQLFRHGSNPTLPFSPIVSSGPNSANPHAVPSERKLTEGDLLVIDWGANVDGYYSDITRTFAVGKVADEFQQIAEIVHKANRAGRAAAGPGIHAKDIDRAARSVIENAGYGEFFIHRTGHGLGLEVHEAPYIREDNPLLLSPGMTFTVEPGIYLPGRNGARIEDDVVITADGMESLSDFPRQLVVIG